MTKGPARCSVCGERAIEITRDPITIDFREGRWSVRPDFDYERCCACGEELYPADGLSELTRQAVAMARREMGLLTPDEPARHPERTVEVVLGEAEGEAHLADLVGGQ